MQTIRTFRRMCLGRESIADLQRLAIEPFVTARAYQACSFGPRAGRDWIELIY